MTEGRRPDTSGAHHTSRKTALNLRDPRRQRCSVKVNFALVRSFPTRKAFLGSNLGFERNRRKREQWLSFIVVFAGMTRVGGYLRERLPAMAAMPVVVSSVMRNGFSISHGQSVATTTHFYNLSTELSIGEPGKR
jgi:hypothetical protein